MLFDNSLLPRATFDSFIFFYIFVMNMSKLLRRRSITYDNVFKDCQSRQAKELI